MRNLHVKVVDGEVPSTASAWRSGNEKADEKRCLKSQAMLPVRFRVTIKLLISSAPIHFRVPASAA
jgi:hypothetical protein